MPLKERFVKKALKKANFPDTFMVGKYACSPYMACGHGCTYCDGRAERYYVEGDFDKDIVARPNLPELLERELPRLRERGIITLGSGITDAYQPVEAKLRLTGRVAEALSRFDFPVTLLTKSSLPLRDIDYWREVNKKAGFTLLITLNHGDDTTRHQFEPGAAAVEERLEVLKAFKKEGCATGIMAMPLLPGITDTEEHIRTLYELALEAEADFFFPGGLTLRPGRQKECFLASVKEYYPGLLGLYGEIYREERTSGTGTIEYQKLLGKKIQKVNRIYKLSPLLPHILYRNKLQLYDEVYVLLSHMIELFAEKHIDTSPLKRAYRRYKDWLGERKKLYNRRPSLHYRDLEGELMETAQKGGLETLLKNEKLSRFLKEVIIDRKTFNYVTLGLE